jgi:hypothetical protein
MHLRRYDPQHFPIDGFTFTMEPTSRMLASTFGLPISWPTELPSRPGEHEPGRRAKRSNAHQSVHSISSSDLSLVHQKLSLAQRRVRAGFLPTSTTIVPSSGASPHLLPKGEGPRRSAFRILGQLCGHEPGPQDGSFPRQLTKDCNDAKRRHSTTVTYFDPNSCDTAGRQGLVESSFSQSPGELP